MAVFSLEKARLSLGFKNLAGSVDLVDSDVESTHNFCFFTETFAYQIGSEKPKGLQIALFMGIYWQAVYQKKYDAGLIINANIL